MEQVLALNRGEQNKILTIKLTVPKQVETQFLGHLRQVWVPYDAPGKSLGSFGKIKGHLWHHFDPFLVTGFNIRMGDCVGLVSADRKRTRRLFSFFSHS